MLHRMAFRLWRGSAALFLAAASATAAGTPESTAVVPETVFLVIYRAGPAWPTGKTLSELPLREHGRYMLGLYRRGQLRTAGGFGDDSGGAAVLEVESVEAARAIADADPAVTSGLFLYEVRPWRLMPWAAIAARQAPPGQR